MRNQAYILAACAAAVIGCGGGHHNTNKSGTTGTTTSTTGGGGFVVALGGTNYGRVEVSYLTGQGRAAGDTYLEITRQNIQNADGVNVYERTDGIGPIELRLPGFQTLATGIDVPFTGTSGNVNSVALTQLVFDPNRVLVEQADGSLDTAPYPLPTTATVGRNLSLPANIEARIRAFPGRTSLIQLRLSDAVFYVDPTLGTYVFDQARFGDLNNSTTGTDPTASGLLASRLSDFVRFSVQNLPEADRPYVRTSYDDVSDTDTSRPRAGYVYFSGDNAALSSAAGGLGSTFEEIDPSSDDAVIGSWANKPSTNVGDFVGTYNLTDANPVEVAGVPTRLVSMFGSFHDYTEVLTGGGSFEMVMFPNSGEEYDTNRQGDIVGIARDGNNKITNLYIGGVDLQSGTFNLLPIFYLGVSPSYGEDGLTDGVHPRVTAATVTGTVSGYVNGSGASTSAANAASIRRMRFAFTGTAPTGASTTGTVTVFRS